MNVERSKKNFSLSSFSKREKYHKITVSSRKQVLVDKNYVIKNLKNEDSFYDAFLLHFSVFYYFFLDFFCFCHFRTNDEVYRKMKEEKRNEARMERMAVRTYLRIICLFMILLKL